MLFSGIADKIKKQWAEITAGTTVYAALAYILYTFYPQIKKIPDLIKGVEENRTILKQQLGENITVIPDEAIRQEEDFILWFTEIHKGELLEGSTPLKAGERLFANWTIPVRPKCDERQSLLIRPKSNLWATNYPFKQDFPSTPLVKGATEQRYRHSARDRRTNKFTSQQGVKISEALQNGCYDLFYTYYWENCFSEKYSTLLNKKRVQASQAIGFCIDNELKGSQMLINTNDNYKVIRK